MSRPRGEVAAGREPPEIPEWAAMIVSLGNPSRDTGSRRKDECADAGSALPDAAGGSTLAKEKKKKKLSAVRNSRRNARGGAGEGSVSFPSPAPLPFPLVFVRRDPDVGITRRVNLAFSRRFIFAFLSRYCIAI